MKKFLLLTFCLIPSFLLSVQEKTKKQKVKEFLTTKPMMVMYGALGGGIAVKVFVYDALKKNTSEKIQKLEQDNTQQEEMLLGVYIYREVRNDKNGMRGLLQTVVKAEKELLELRSENNTFILSTRNTESSKALQELNDLKKSLNAYNKIASLFDEKKICFQDYNQGGKQGIIFTDL